MSQAKKYFLIPYLLWIVLFIITPLVMIFYTSFKDLDNHFTLENYKNFLSPAYLEMTLSSFIYALIITVICLIVAYPVALALRGAKNKQFWLLLIILPTWINLLLKTYAFIGILSQEGTINDLLSALDLGADQWTTFKKIVMPLSWEGVKTGIQVTFIPTLSLFMITRLIAGNKVVNLGTAIEEQFLVTQNYGMGSTIAVFLILAMALVMIITKSNAKERRDER